MINCIKLVSGEEIIGDTEEKFNGDIVVTKPLLIVMMPSQSGGEFTVGLAPFLPYAKDKSFFLERKNILLMFPPATAMYNQYNQITGGLVVSQPNNGQLVLL